MDNYEDLMKRAMIFQDKANKCKSFINQLDLLTNGLDDQFDFINYLNRKKEITTRKNALHELYNKSINQYHEIINKMETIDKKTIDISIQELQELDKTIQTTIPSLDPCMICESYIGIPITPTCWKCTSNPLPTCRIVICLDCFLQLIENNSNDIQCPVCRTHTIVQDINTSFTVNFEKMRILDDLIKSFYNKKIIQCYKCKNQFSTLYSYWEHFVNFHMKN